MSDTYAEPTETPDAPAPPTDRELVALLRARLRGLEQTGHTRQAAWDAMVASAGDPRKTAAFLNAYERTMPERLEASRALHDALRADFRTALLSSEDVTDEQIAAWLTDGSPVDGAPA